MVVCKSAMPKSQIKEYSCCWVYILSHRLCYAIQKCCIVAIDAGNKEWRTRAVWEVHVCCIDMDNKRGILSKIYDSQEVVLQLRDMQNIQKLNSSTLFPIYDWIKYHRAHLSWADNSIVGKLDCDVFQGIIAQPVIMRGHMRSGPWVCIPIMVSIEHKWQEGIRGRGTKTYIAYALNNVLKAYGIGSSCLCFLHRESWFLFLIFYSWPWF